MKNILDLACYLVVYYDGEHSKPTKYYEIDLSNFNFARATIQMINDFDSLQSKHNIKFHYELYEYMTSHGEILKDKDGRAIKYETGINLEITNLEILFTLLEEIDKFDDCDFARASIQMINDIYSICNINNVDLIKTYFEYARDNYYGYYYDYDEFVETYLFDQLNIHNYENILAHLDKENFALDIINSEFYEYNGYYFWQF